MERSGRQDQPLPAVAITMGDPAGVGPELCLRALAQPTVLNECTPVVFGDKGVLLRVADRCALPMPEHILTLDQWSKASSRNAAHARRLRCHQRRYRIARHRIRSLWARSVWLHQVGDSGGAFR